MIDLFAEAGTYLLVWCSGAATALGVRALLLKPRPQHQAVEGIDGLDRALDAASSDLPTQGLPRHSPGTVYASRHRRKSQSRWMASMGRPHPRRVRGQSRHLP